MASTSKPKATKGARNDTRSNGKAWKQGKAPEQRQKELDAKRERWHAESSDERRAKYEARKRKAEACEEARHTFRNSGGTVTPRKPKQKRLTAMQAAHQDALRK